MLCVNIHEQNYLHNIAMANDAIDNARRAAASSRSKRTTVASTAATAVPPATKSAEYLKKHKHYQDVGSTSYSSAMTGSSSKQYHGRENMNNNNKHNKNNVAHASANMDLKHNDGAYQVIATLLTERLLPKVNASPGSTHYTLTAEDAAFFQKMLPHSVRRNFVDALRYRLQLLKSGVGSKDSSVGKLTMQCAMLGLDRTNLNVLLELSSSAGTSVSWYQLSIRCILMSCFLCLLFYFALSNETRLLSFTNIYAVSDQLQKPRPCRQRITNKRISVLIL